MRVLVTGTDGYIGALVTPLLIDRGHEVRGVDTGFYRDGWLPVDSGPGGVRPPICRKDLRHIGLSDLVDCDVVVHLAELSDDPLGEIDHDVTYEINHAGSVALGRLAREAGVRRFVYASSCSVYGISDEDTVTEESRTAPQTAYAKCKLLVERDLAAMADDSFVPVFLRNATAYGASPRMRFDSILNNLSGSAWTTGKITLVSDGTPWRPLVHIEDIGQAIACALEAPDDAVRGEIFNVGQDGENYRVREIAAMIAEAFPGCEMTHGSADPHQRSYRVSFRKISKCLPGFECRWTVKEGIRQLRELFERIDLDEEQFRFRAFTRVKALKHLQQSGQIDQRLFWR